MVTEEHKLAVLWLTTGGRSLWQELGVKDAKPIPVEHTDTMWTDQRAEAMLLGCLLIEGAPAVDACQRARLLGIHFSAGRYAIAYAEAMTGKPVGQALCAHVGGEYLQAFDELFQRRIYHPAGDVAFALARRIVNLARARERIIEAGQLLNGYEVA